MYTGIYQSPSWEAMCILSGHQPSLSARDSLILALKVMCSRKPVSTGKTGIVDYTNYTSNTESVWGANLGAKAYKYMALSQDAEGKLSFILCTGLGNAIT